MITRVSQLRVDPTRIDAAEQAVRDVLAPAVLACPGATAGRWMVDPATGEVLTAVQWSDEDAMFAAGGTLAPVRDRVVATLCATPVSLQVHDVIGVSADRPLTLDQTAWSRVVLLDDLEDRAAADAAALFRIYVDEHRGADDFVGAAWSVDLESRSALCVSTWLSPPDAGSPDERDAPPLWSEIARALSVRITSTSWRRTVGRTPADHLLDLTVFDRVAAHLAG